MLSYHKKCISALFSILVYNSKLAINNKQVTELYKGIILKLLRIMVKLPLLLSFYAVLAISLAACGTLVSNNGVIILNVQDKIHTYVTGQNLPKTYKLGNGEQELQRFETFCRKEIRASQLDGSEEVVFENIKHGIHGQVEFRKCSDKITRIYRY